MKKILTVLMLLALSASMIYAQKDVTRFLGIPVDGTKKEMIRKLVEKGFEYNSTYDRLEGEFNGAEVVLSVVTNNNKVYRIVVLDQIHQDETNIKIRFNTLCRQFQNNKRYIPDPTGNFIIPDNEDISYEMTVNDKRYEADFYQKPLSDDPDSDTYYDTLFNKSVWFMIQDLYGQYFIVMFYDNKYNEANGEDL